MRAASTLLLLAACAGDDVVPGDTDVEPDAASYLRFLAVDNALVAQVKLVDTRGEGGWTAVLPSGAPRDLAVVGDEVLVSTGSGAVWLSLDDGRVLREITGFSGVQSARPLDDGQVLLGAQDGDDVVLTTVDADGEQVGGPLRLAGYGDLRLVRRLDDGHTLFTAGKGGWHAFEVDAAGNEVWSAPLPGKGYLAERQPDGTTLASTGETVSVVQLDADGTTSRTWGGRDRDPELAPAAFFSGFSRVDDDHVAVANWHGHDLTQGGPHVVLYGADGARTWEWADDDLVQVTNVLVLEAVGVDAL